MRLPIFTGGSVVAAGLLLAAAAMADVPGVPSLPAHGSATASSHHPATPVLMGNAPAQCGIPASTLFDSSPVVRSGKAPFSLQVEAGPVGDQDIFYRGMMDVATTEGKGPVVVMQQMDHQAMQLQASAGMHYSIPSAPFNLAFIMRNQTEMESSFSSSAQQRRLWGADPFAPDADSSARTMTGTGQTLSEAGLTLDHAFPWGVDPLGFDAALTARRQDLYNYDLPLAGYQGYQTASLEQYGLDEEQGINIDAGLSKTLYGFDMAFRVANLFPHGMERDEDIYGTKTSATVATSLNCGFSTARLQLGWDARNGIGSTPDQRYATAGMVFSAATAGISQPQVHVGYRRDLIDSLDSTASLGVGFSPSRGLDLGISGIHARSGAYGVMAELGFKLR